MYVKVRATPEAKKESFVKEKKDVFRVSVKEPAQGNRANRKVIELVAKHFKISEEKVRIVNGHHHFSKLISIKE